MAAAKIIKKKFKERPNPGAMILLGVVLDDGYDYEYWIPREWEVDWDTVLPMIKHDTRAEWNHVIDYLSKVNGVVASEAKSS
jgi:hypothetical protein